ncbi:SIMPL domain-containing protein [Sedimenticola hydrogenitrophicus]|uniref:SIMPL domain-containing protein n=1 Tax=Sedimenticola hydrogenitrophicus TaxID=2967975 RepID=UPI0021A5DF8C|nr:SIMPL domain-containing protein [Sedimenticola hydrogenitrophicus]
MTLRYLLLLLTLSTGQLLADEPPTYDRINLTVSAAEEVDNDTLSATLFVQHEGSDPAELGARVNRTMRQAVETAKQQPGIKVQTLDYQTSPVYRSNTLSGWRVRQSLRLEGRDAAAISELMGKLQPALGIGGISYGISPQRREQIEERLIRQALQRFRTRAELISQAMGHNRYRLVQMNISQDGAGPRPYPLQAMTLRAETAPTLEAGSQRLEVQINGTIELRPE